MANLKGAVKIVAGTMIGKKTIKYLRQALKLEADCGCGIDCCNGAVVLPEIDGDGIQTGRRYKIQVIDGVLTSTLISA